MHLYLKHHKCPASGPTKRPQQPPYVQRIVSMQHAHWIEFDPKRNVLRIKMPDTFLPDEYTVDEGQDPNLVKRTFYDILKDVRQNGKVVEWDG
jgi:hypothetical protein